MGDRKQEMGMPQRGVTGSVSRRAHYNGLENCGPLCPAVGMAKEPVLGTNVLLPLSLGLCIPEERIPSPAAPAGAVGALKSHSAGCSALGTDGNVVIRQRIWIYYLLANPLYPSQTFRIFFPNQPKAGVVGVRGDGKGDSLSPTPLELLRSLAKSAERAGIGSLYLERGW